MTVPVQNTRFLTLLQEVLLTVQPENYSQCQWGGGEKKGVFCNTLACAAGWATTIPEIRKAGLRLHRSVWGAPEIRFKRIEDPYEGLERCFGLTQGEVEFIFGTQDTDPPDDLRKGRNLKGWYPSYRTTPLEAAGRIALVLKGGLRKVKRAA